MSLDTNPQLDLGIDSLAWLNLGMEIEDRFGFNLSEEMIIQVTTVRDLLEQLRDAPEGGSGQSREVDAERWLKAPGPAGQAAGYLLHLLARGLAKAYFRLEVSGREGVPSEGPLIIAFNHVSDVDPLVAGAALDYAHMKRIWWGADADRVFGSRLGRLFARILHLFPVDDRAPKASLEVAQQVLERGNVLIWFPEEWRSPTGELQRFLPGVGRLIAETDASVVPAFIDGAFEAMPRNRRLPRPVRIHVRFGAVQGRGDLEAVAPEEGSEEERIAEGLKRKVAEVAKASG